MNTLALIPARSGSKSIVEKNVRMVAGKPLLAWSIEQALTAEQVDRVIVSTDSEQYADIARDYGAEAPFLRPAEISGDASTDLETFEHALTWLRGHEGNVPDICVHLRPTYPLRNVSDIDAIVKLLVENTELDSVRTITEVLHPPFKMWYRADDGRLSPVVRLDGVPEPWNEPRQKLPRTYIQTANIDAVRSSVILEQHSMTGKRIFGYVEHGFHDVDTEDELRAVERMLRPRNEGAPVIDPQAGDRRTFCFDIDGVIAQLAPDNNYAVAEPNREMVETVNRLYAAGHRIVLHTARGSMTGIDWREKTEEQLARWGVKYHELVLGKPAADFYIDDRMMSLEDVREFAGKGGISR
jgi:CMP-N,N'-diacetyllegionaminic acid synthase